MTTSEIIPEHINNRLLLFKDQVDRSFSFLNQFNFSLDKFQLGRNEVTFHYFCDFSFRNGSVVLNINYKTDIINGFKRAHPELKAFITEDDSISSTITAPNGFLIVKLFKQITRPVKGICYFEIDSTRDINIEIERVTNNYSEFILSDLAEVLSKKIMYECCFDRYNDIVFEKRYYR
jgi:hypothetical protein